MIRSIPLEKRLAIAVSFVIIRQRHPQVQEGKNADGGNNGPLSSAFQKGEAE
ncbi:MAG: hypothetical protein K2N87_17570 [Eubacterium sp.]|nr:hypothetical protein [Eubacterium sp.]